MNPVVPTPPGGDASSAEEARRQREVAQRVFAAEFNLASHTLREEGPYSPTFAVSPFGARINRLLAVGVLTAIEPVGQTGDRFRAQVVDATGTFNVYAGQYEPEATAQLNEIRPPALVAVVGKSRTYQPEAGVTYVSVRPESVRAIERADRDAWVLETVRHGLARLEALREAQKMEKPTPKALEDLGFSKDVAEGVVKAVEHYGKADLAKYGTMLRDALESLMPGAAERIGAEPSFAPASAVPAPAPARAAPARPAPAAPAENPHEGLILQMIDDLDDPKGAPWEDIVASASKKGVKESEVEECLNALMDKGQVYEPVLGRIKRT